jgi:hypothetical protein
VIVALLACPVLTAKLFSDMRSEPGQYPKAAEAFLRKNSIEEEEMKRPADEKFLYPL